jgi:hypothetical protein
MFRPYAFNPNMWSARLFCSLDPMQNLLIILLSAPPSDARVYVYCTLYSVQCTCGDAILELRCISELCAIGRIGLALLTKWEILFHIFSIFFSSR